MKIAFVLDDSLDKPDGVQQYVTTLGHWLSGAGHEVHYLVGETHRRDLDHIHSLSRNIAVNFNGNRVSIPLPINKRNIRALLANERFDVLHVQLPYSPMLGARVIMAAPASTAVVGTFHIVPFSAREQLATRLLRQLLARSLGRFHGVMSVSRPAADFAHKSLGLSSIVVPNVVDVQFMRGGHKIKKFQDGKTNIVFLGRLVERKGCLYFLAALNRLHQQRLLEDVRVVICGKGPLEATLRKYVEDHQLADFVHFAGFISEAEKADYLASAQLAVFPSLAGESFGIVLIEAMAAGSETVLAGDNSGYRSVMAGQKQQLFNPKDTPVFSDALLHFIGSDLARRQAYHWQQTRLRLYDVREVGKVITKQYQTAISLAKSS